MTYWSVQFLDRCPRRHRSLVAARRTEWPLLIAAGPLTTVSPRQPGGPAHQPQPHHLVSHAHPRSTRAKPRQSARRRRCRSPSITGAKVCTAIQRATPCVGFDVARSLHCSFPSVRALRAAIGRGAQQRRPAPVAGTAPAPVAPQRSEELDAPRGSKFEQAALAFRVSARSAPVCAPPMDPRG